MKKAEPTVFLSFDEMSTRVTLSRTTLYGLMRLNQFPHPIKIGRSSRWVKAEVEAWVEAVAAGRSVPSGTGYYRPYAAKACSLSES